MNFAKSYLSKAAPVEPTIQHGRVVARLTCSECGAKDEWTVASKMPPPEILTKHFSNKGWSVRKRPTCPNCNAPKEKPVMSNVAPIKTEQAPTEAVKAARRKANEFLMFHFDVENGRYEDGWSDERVAKDSGMPIAWVVKRRDEEYGPLKEPGEFAEIREQAKVLASEIGKLNARLAMIAKSNGWSV